MAGHTGQLSPSIATDAVPVALRELRQWVVWRFEMRDGEKPTKVPYDPRTGQKAATDDPVTWSSFADAQEAQHRFDGVGFVFSPDDPFAGIDLDHCLAPETGLLQPWAREILDLCGPTYAEVSPSGEGIKIWLRDTLPAEPRHKRGKLPPDERGAIELYDRRRFFTVTGDRYGDAPMEIHPPMVALATIHDAWMPTPPSRNDHGNAAATRITLEDAEVLALARRAQNGPKFSRLWNGDTSDYGGDESSADLALCGMLAFWSGADATQMDRLFRASGLFRPKWDARRGTQTYGELTLATAVAGCTQTYQGRHNFAQSSRTDVPASSEMTETAPSGDPGPYRVDQGRICREKSTQHGPFLEPLCNFAAVVTEELVLDDGAETTRAFTVEG